MASFGGTMPRKRDFDKEAPADYVPGLGRGATGFTTRSDIGPARPAPDLPASSQLPIPQSMMPPAGRGRGAAAPMAPPPIPLPGQKRPLETEAEDLTESNYDEWGGYGGHLFSDSPYDEEDKDADDVWENVDDKMDERRKDRREKKLKEELEKYHMERPKIQLQFADLKKDLAGISEDEWASIPETGDHTLRYKQQRQEQFTPAPGSLLEKARLEHQQVASIDAKQGLETPMTPMTDLTSLGAGKGTVLGLKLDKVADSVSGQTVVDPKGFLTDLNSVKINSDAEISDIKKARLLLRSVTNTNKKHGPGWIAAARLEEVAGRLAAAREVIAQGCKECPENEEVWLEAARLQTAANAPKVLTNALKHIPKSIKIWLHAAKMEKNIREKKKILRRAIEIVPNSVALWKAAIEHEEDKESARVMLATAVECVPYSVDMWLALAKLETYEQAKKVLNKAREVLPSEPAIWITAAKLEEAHAHVDNVSKIISVAVRGLEAKKVVTDRETWIKEAKECERLGNPVTCAAIIHAAIGMGVEDVDRKHMWIDDAEKAVEDGCLETARTIYAHALKELPGKKSLWIKAAELEKVHGTPEALEEILDRAVRYCPKAEILWLMAAKEAFLRKDIDTARRILTNAFNANPQSESIILAAVKVENDNNETLRARILLQKARENVGSERCWRKSALLERDAGEHAMERQYIEEAIERFPKQFKFWLMLAQLELREKHIEEARKALLKGVKNCPTCVPLWTFFARFEEDNSGAGRARSVLDKAKLKITKSADLHLAGIRLELRCGDMKAASNLMARALKDGCKTYVESDCPKSGVLWSESIAMEPRPKQKGQASLAIKTCENDAVLTSTVGRLFWSDRKVDKARKWLERSVRLQDDNGDLWAFWYKFESQHGDEAKLEDVMKRYKIADPVYGEFWVKVSKAPGNNRLSKEELMKRVVASLPDRVLPGGVDFEQVQHALQESAATR